MFQGDLGMFVDFEYKNSRGAHNSEGWDQARRSRRVQELIRLDSMLKLWLGKNLY